MGGREGEGLSSYRYVNHKICSLSVTLHSTTCFGMLYSA